VTDPEDAWKAACEIGLPVVVKPKDGNQGKGVTVNITTKEHLLKAYATATEFRDDILVERYMPGNDFRLLVVGDKLVAAARRDPPKVVGDGVAHHCRTGGTGQPGPAPGPGPLHLADQNPH
jgi:cyanophycin synthetase